MSKDCAVFLSYAAEDRPWVSQFVSSMREAGVQPWYDAHELALGDNVQDRTSEALRESSTVVMVLSGHSLNSPSTFFELGAALADKKRIIPVLMEDVDTAQLPMLLTRIQALKESSPVEAARRVAEVVEKISGKAA